MKWILSMYSRTRRFNNLAVVMALMLAGPRGSAPAPTSVIGRFVDRSRSRHPCVSYG